MNEDLQTLTGLVQRYETIRSNYNFSNEQLFEMNRIEGNVVAIIGKYLKESQIAKQNGYTRIRLQHSSRQTPDA